VLLEQISTGERPVLGRKVEGPEWVVSRLLVNTDIDAPAPSLCHLHVPAAVGENEAGGASVPILTWLPFASSTVTGSVHLLGFQ